MAPNTAPVVIDHTAFPHILDTITTYSSRSALLALRGTCRFLRDKADAALADHLVLTAGTPPSLAARDGRLPILRRRNGAKGCENIWAGARVVDIVGQVGTYPRSPFVMRLNSLGSVQTVRMRHPPGGSLAPTCVLRSEVLVVFTTITERDDSTDTIFRQFPALAHTCAIPNHTRKSVYNIRYDVNRPWLAQAYIIICPHSPIPQTCTELVFIFTEKKTHREPQVGGGSWPANREKGMLNSVIDILAATRYRPELCVTLVDVHTLRSQWLGDPPEWAAAEVQDGILAAVDSLALTIEARGAPLPLPRRKPPLSTIRFMSRAEYRKLVGDAVFALETVE